MRRLRDFWPGNPDFPGCDVPPAHAGQSGQSLPRGVSCFGTAPGDGAGAGGGGGSGFGPAGTAFETGVQEGDGTVTLSWTPGTGCVVEAIVVEPTFTG